MANEQMLFPYQNTSRQFKEMEMQGILVTMANLAIHGQREEEMNQERMRYDQILQEAAAQQAREANKGKSREVVPDSEEEFVSSESDECFTSNYELLNYSIVKGEELCSPNNEGNQDEQQFLFDPEIEITLRKLKKQTKASRQLNFEEVEENNMAADPRRALGDYTIPSTVMRCFVNPRSRQVYRTVSSNTMVKWVSIPRGLKD
ncbi:hypothetical protein PIB30_050971 [Stylosanthes scabra]|uniref:Uncharacterized protein n=1 Tax=Stylosanthes scabra TaxID=79078 RepID=A0ABU6ZGI0_9FABA|nr:hypothetical protein [Stylosanthes scabra]